MKKQILTCVLTFFIGLFSVNGVENAMPISGQNIVRGTVSVCHTMPVEWLLGASVKITRLSNPTGLVAAVSTGPNGAFIVGYLSSGNYKIEVAYLGYLTIEENFTIPSSPTPQTVTLNLCTMPDEQ